MYLNREYIQRPMYDFANAEGKTTMENFAEEDLVALINYMKSYRFTLGIDFSFVMGYDAPGSKYNVAVNGLSYMLWYDNPGKDHSKHISHQKEVQICISHMKSEKLKTDHLEVWPNDDEEPPFYKGQRVRGSSECHPDSNIKTGREYIVRICHYAECKGAWYWYVGVEGYDNDWLTPRLFEAVNP